MSSQYILPVEKPIIASNTEHGYLLSGVQTNSLSEEWMMSNYVHQVLHGINMAPDMNFYPITNHAACPCIDYLRISRDMVKKKWDSVLDFLFESIEEQYYVIIHLDWFYLPGSALYQSQNYMHPVLIYGFDKELQQLYVGDFNANARFSFYQLSFSDVLKSFECSETGRKMTFVNERYLYINDIILYKNRTSMKYSFNMDIFRKALEDFLDSVNISNVYAQGDYCYFASALFGINSFREAGNMMNMKYREFESIYLNYKVFTVPLERTHLMLKRLAYLKEKKGVLIPDSLVNEFSELYNHYRILLSMVIKCNLLKNNQSMMLKIINNIQSISYEEERLLLLLLKNLST